ncbi:MAG: hypothetical protein AAF958_09235, partial [Planctomycetota bacterium]
NINIRLHPAEPRVIASLATAAFRAGYRDTALAQCKRAIRMRPQEERYTELLIKIAQAAKPE